MLTSADIYLIEVVGDTILVKATTTTTESVLYGASELVAFGYHVLVPFPFLTLELPRKRGFKSLPSILIFSAIVINFILVSAYWASDVALFFHLVRYDLMDQTPDTFNNETLANFNKIIWRYLIAQTALQQLMLTLNNSIVVWRAWVVVQRKRMIALPVLLVVASTGKQWIRTGIVSSNFRWFIAFLNLNLSIVHIMLGASLILSFLANTFATFLIVRTLCPHMRCRKALGIHRKLSQPLKALVIMIDTGVAFLLLQGMYPTIVVYLINQQRSFVEVFALSDLNGNGTPEMPFDATDGPLVFAHSDPTADATSLADVSESDMGFRGALNKDGFVAREKVQEMV
ncbi:hypothetical protein C0995_013727 [Termitomyces sp. Mi166|nr:hypothetical protein C0995_013727 [Termitomyces sp. Mi166\